jgi:hypothetical protein
MERLVERAMAYAVEEYDDDLAVARRAWLARDDQAALDQACDVCLSDTDMDLGIRGRAIGLLARVLYPDLLTTPPKRELAPLSANGSPHGDPDGRGMAGAVQPQQLTHTSRVLLAGVPFGEQLLGGLGLALQPGQGRRLVHPGHLLTRRQPLAHDRDDLAVGGRLVGQHPAVQQR